jgi:hypothetical protein
LIAYLRVGHAAHLVLIELVEGLGGLLLADVEAAGLNDTLDFAGVHTSISVQVKAVEGLIQIEAGLALKALADGLSSNLNLKVHAPHVSELNLSVWVEAVITAIGRVLMVGGATVQHVIVVPVRWKESFGELIEAKTHVLVAVVAVDEKVDLIAGREDTDGRETLANVGSCNLATEVNIEDTEGVVDVEIGLVRERNLGGLKLTFKGDDVAKAIDQSVLLVEVEDGLLSGGAAHGAGAGGEVAGTTVTAAREVRAGGAGASTDGGAPTDGGASHGGTPHRVRSHGGTSHRGASHRVRSHRRASHRGATNGRAANGRAAHRWAANGAAVAVCGLSAGQVARLERGAVASGRSARDRLGSTDRVRAAHEFRELCVAETSITIGVHAADDGEELALAAVVSGGAKESAEVESINTSIVVFIDGAVGSHAGVVIATLKLALESFTATLEVDLLFDHIKESWLDIASEGVKTTDAGSGAVNCHVPE